MCCTATRPGPALQLLRFPDNTGAISGYTQGWGYDNDSSGTGLGVRTVMNVAIKFYSNFRLQQTLH